MPTAWIFEEVVGQRLKCLMRPLGLIVRLRLKVVFTLTCVFYLSAIDVNFIFRSFGGVRSFSGVQTFGVSYISERDCISRSYCLYVLVDLWSRTLQLIVVILLVYHFFFKIFVVSFTF